MVRWYNGSRFLPESVRFEEMPAERKLLAARLTARFVSQWGTHYEAWPVTDRATIRHGKLPRIPTNRIPVVDEAFDWVLGLLAARGLPWQWVGLVLYHRKRLVLDQHDGIPADLFLTNEQFNLLQERWRHEGLPDDLYFPADAQRVVTEPLLTFGGLVLGPGRYSPLQWARREAAPRANVSLPSEEERQLALIQACLQFVRALGRRRAELTEPGQSVDTDELAKVRALERLVASLSSETAARVNRRHPPEGWPSSDTQNIARGGEPPELW